MTDTACWLEFDNDAELTDRIAQGYFEEKEGSALRPWHFPPTQSRSPYWPNSLSDWCVKQWVEITHRSHLEIAAEVEKAQIIDFIAYMYDGDSSYQDPACALTWKGKAYLANRLTNLKAFVAQELQDGVVYGLVADEF